jgi:hypothetical protein
MLVQMAVAGVAGVAVFAKVFWARLTGPFRRKSTSPEDGVVAAPQPADD